MQVGPWQPLGGLAGAPPPDRSPSGAATDRGWGPRGHLGSTDFTLRLFRAFTLARLLFNPTGSSEKTAQDSGDTLNCSSTQSCPGTPVSPPVHSSFRPAPR